MFKFKAALKNAVTMFDKPEFIENIKDEDPTMVKHLDILKKINQHGYITTNSQAGRKEPTIYERAYVTGFMSKKDAGKFIQNMNIETDKNAIAVVWSHYPDPKLDIPLTIENKKGKWKVFTHMSTSISLQFYTHEKQKTNLLFADNEIVYIFCWDPKWNRNASSKNGLFTDILKILKTI